MVNGTDSMFKNCPCGPNQALDWLKIVFFWGGEVSFESLDWRKEQHVKHVGSPSEEVIRAKKSVILLKWTRSTPSDLQSVAISKHAADRHLPIVSGGGGGSMNWLNDATEEVQMRAVRNNGYDIYYIKNPSRNVQLEAVRRSPWWQPIIFMAKIWVHFQNNVTQVFHLVTSLFV